MMCRRFYNLFIKVPNLLSNDKDASRILVEKIRGNIRTLGYIS